MEEVPRDGQMVRREAESAAAGCPERGKAFMTGGWSSKDGGSGDCEYANGEKKGRSMYEFVKVTQYAR